MAFGVADGETAAFALLAQRLDGGRDHGVPVAGVLGDHEHAAGLRGDARGGERAPPREPQTRTAAAFVSGEAMCRRDMSGVCPLN